LFTRAPDVVEAIAVAVGVEAQVTDDAKEVVPVAVVGRVATLLTIAVIPHEPLPPRFPLPIGFVVPSQVIVATPVILACTSLLTLAKKLVDTVAVAVIVATLLTTAV
jgi:hypothetical protein